MKKVSCIIATFNRVEYIERAIQSVLLQTYENIEIIVVDDGSTDNTKEVLNEYIVTGRIKYIYQENKGCWEARDNGIKNSSGDYIAILDSDDYWIYLDKIHTQVEFLEGHTNYVLVGGCMQRINNKYMAIGKTTYPEFDDKIRKVMLFENPFSHSTVLYRKNACVQVGCYCSKSPASDWRLWMKLGEIGKMYNLQRVLTCYSTDSQNISQVNAHSKSKDDIMLRKQYRKDYPNFLKAYILSWISYYYYYFPLKKQAYSITKVIKKYIYGKS